VKWAYLVMALFNAALLGCFLVEKEYGLALTRLLIVVLCVQVAILWPEKEKA
jgi:hypothetical protein